MGNMMIIELVLRKMLQEPPIFDGEKPMVSCSQSSDYVNLEGSYGFPWTVIYR